MPQPAAGARLSGIWARAPDILLLQLDLCLRLTSERNADAALAFVLAQSGRVRAVCLHAQGNPAVFLFVSRLRRTTLPRLAHFEIDLRPNTKGAPLGHLPHILDADPPPALASVALRGVCFELHSAMLRGLTSLSLADLPRRMAVPSYTTSAWQAFEAALPVLGATLAGVHTLRLAYLTLTASSDALVLHFLRPWLAVMQGQCGADSADAQCPVPVWPRLELLTVRAPFDSDDEDGIDDTLEFLGSLRLAMELPFDVWQECIPNA